MEIEKFLYSLQSFKGIEYKEYAYILNTSSKIDCIGLIMKTFAEFAPSVKNIVITKEMYDVFTPNTLLKIENLSDFIILSNNKYELGDILLFNMPRNKIHFAIITGFNGVYANILHARSDIGSVCENTLDAHLEKYLQNIIRYKYFT